MIVIDVLMILLLIAVTVIQVPITDKIVNQIHYNPSFNESKHKTMLYIFEIVIIFYTISCFPCSVFIPMLCRMAD